MAVVGVAVESLHVSDELAARGPGVGRCDADLAAELVRLVRLALSDALDLRGMEDWGQV